MDQSVSRPINAAMPRKAEQVRRRILFAAERLFAERGIEAVSLREIAALANHGNNNAVQYHFGTKAGLIDAIFEFRVAQMEDQRRRMMEEAEAAGLLGDALILMQILCLPHLSLQDEDGNYPYAGFMSQYLTRYRPIGLRHAGDLDLATTVHLRRLLGLVAQRINYVPLVVGQSRIALCNLMFVNMLVRRNHTPVDQREESTFKAMVRDTIEIATDALCATYRQRSDTPHWFGL
ncbi:TetR/AcrR family transcriptional regulator [Sphingomonas profundi]|uniref:TetR/AcrR family transcriptional regulator n=1 Tax=Alterirhizorhabdus profundi TaxID=2681549 RepID=UPI0018D046CB|nr:TetR/AcrR family transcriptional regulator [Sphingomonas profundi]